MNTNCPLLQEALSKANPEQIDTLWALLKYKEIGIYRKVKCMCTVLNVDFEKVSENLPKDDNGRILDYNTRYFIHDQLVQYS